MITDIGQDITHFLCASKDLFTNRLSLQNIEDLAYKIVIVRVFEMSKI